MKTTISKLLNSQNLKNSFWNIIGAALYPLLIVFTTPFFITKLGETQYGIWVLITSTTQLMNVFNLGLGDANIKFISKHFALGQKSEVEETVSATFNISIFIAVLCVFTGLVVGALISSVNLFDFQGEYKELAIKTFPIGFSFFGLKFIEVVLLAVLQGFERYDYASTLSLISRVVILAANAVMVSLGYTVVGIFVTSCMVQVIMLVTEFVFIKSRYPFLLRSFKISSERVKRLFDFSIWTWLQSAMAIVTTQLDKFIVAYFLGLETLSYYSLGSMVQTQLHSLYATAASWIFPAVSKKQAMGEPLNTFYYTAQAFLLGVGFLSITFILLFEHQLLTLWLGDEIYSRSAVYIRLFLYYNLLLLLNIVPFFFLNGTGHVKFNTASELSTKILNIFGMIVLFEVLGATGLVWGLIISMIVASPIKIGLVLKHVLMERQIPNIFVPLLCPILLILMSETQSFELRLVLLGSFIWSFYITILQKSSVVREIVHDIKKRVTHR